MTYSTPHIIPLPVKMAAVALLLAISHLAAMAQPSWTKRAAPALCTLKTFHADGTLLGSSNALFVGSNGLAVAPFEPFDGAARAIIIDSRGRELPVECIIGANDIYNVAKFGVSEATAQPLDIALDSVAMGAKAWILAQEPGKKPVCHQAIVQRVERIQGGVPYYTLATPQLENIEGCPVLNDEGQVIATMQRPYANANTTNYAVGIGLAMAMQTTGLSLNDATLRRTTIKKALPSQLDQALLMLYVAGSSLDSVAYSQLLDDFIAAYPHATDGYVYKAQAAVRSGRLALADKLMQQALANATSKDDAHYNYARLILQAQGTPAAVTFGEWTPSKAATHAQAAWAANAVPTYRQVEAEALMADGRYNEAYQVLMQLAQGPMPSAEVYFSAARCQELMGDTAATVALLDSAVATFSKPYLRAAAPYLLARATALLQQGQWRRAVADMMDYEKLMATDVNANFYYIRAKAEIEGRMYQPAINDLDKAIEIEPTGALFMAEKAALQVRLGLYTEAMATAQQCIDTDPQLSDGHLLLGLALCMEGDKAMGRESLLKAKQLGNAQADSLIEKYAQ